MSEPAKIEDRVTKLETEMVEVRYLAAKADKETSTNTAVLRGQVGMLNALRADQVDQGKILADHTKILADHTKTLADHTKTLADHGKRLDQLDRKVDDGFAEMRRGFAVLGQGQEVITELLKARDEPEEP